MDGLSFSDLSFSNLPLDVQNKLIQIINFNQYNNLRLVCLTWNYIIDNTEYQKSSQIYQMYQSTTELYI